MHAACTVGPRSVVDTHQVSEARCCRWLVFWTVMEAWLLSLYNMSHQRLHTPQVAAYMQAAAAAHNPPLVPVLPLIGEELAASPKPCSGSCHCCCSVSAVRSGLPPAASWGRAGVLGKHVYSIARDVAAAGDAEGCAGESV